MYALGIDVGTTYTAAAVWRDGRTEICSLGTQSPVIPSVVLVRPDGSTLTGEAAARRALMEPDRVAREFKRRMGDSIPVLLGGSPFSAESLTAHLLRAVMDMVTGQEGAPPSSVVVSHPANWGRFKVDLLQSAVRMADLDVPVSYVTEPEAAAIGYGRLRDLDPGQTVAVYDLGGGTFDAAVLRRTMSGFSILGQPEGIERLGGIDIDAAVFAHLTQIIGEPLTDLDEDDPAAVSAVARLRTECTSAKESLSSDVDTVIPVLLPGFSGEVRLTRAELEAMVRPSLYDTIRALQRALRSADVDPSDLSAVLLVGGSSRMPLVAQLVGAELSCPVAANAHPKHVTAAGAAWLASGAVLPSGATSPAPSQAPSPALWAVPSPVPSPAAAASPLIPAPPMAPASAITPVSPLVPRSPEAPPAPSSPPAPSAPLQVPAAALPSVAPHTPGREGVRILRPPSHPSGVATPARGWPPVPVSASAAAGGAGSGSAGNGGADVQGVESEQDDESQKRRAAVLGGVLGAESGVAGIMGFEAGRVGASAQPQSLAAPPVPDATSGGGMVHGPGGPLSASHGGAPGHGLTPSQAPQPLASQAGGITPTHAPQPLAPHAGPGGITPTHAPQPLTPQPPHPHQPLWPGAHGPSHHPHPHPAGHPAGGTATKAATAARTAARAARAYRPLAVGVATGAAALLVVAAGYFAMTRHRSDTVVAINAPSESTSAPASGPTAPPATSAPLVVPAASGNVPAGQPAVVGTGPAAVVVTTVVQGPQGKPVVTTVVPPPPAAKAPAPPPLVAVPSVVGLSESDARSRLTGAGFTVGTVTRQKVTSPSQDGVVLGQDPSAPTSIAQGSTVNLTIGEIQSVLVPTVVGLTESNARSQIANANLSVGSVSATSVSDRNQDGVVQSQSPGGQSSVPAGSSVDLRIGRYQAPRVTVPSVVGLSEASARSQIGAAKLVVGTVTLTTVSDIELDGEVRAQNPSGESTADQGSRVDLTVARYEKPPTVMVTVPPVIGMTEANARSTITGAKLAVGTVSQTPVTDPKSDGLVQSQTPGGNTSAAVNSTVDLKVGHYTAPTVPTVPSVIGMTETRARSAITTAGYSVGTVTLQIVDNPKQNHIVLQQTPAGQTVLATGRPINLVVGQLRQVVVPSVVNLTEASARSTLTNAGLRVRVSTRAVESANDNGVVLAQSPAGGSSVDVNSTVRITVGKYTPPSSPAGQSSGSSSSGSTSSGSTSSGSSSSSSSSASTVPGGPTLN